MLPTTQLDIGDEMPFGAELQRAIARYAPGAPDITTGQILANGDPTRTVVRAGDEVVVKFGTGVREAEARSMRFVASETNIPVPRLHGVFVERDTTYIVMAYIEGDPLDKIWDTFTITTKEEVSRQLREYFSELPELRSSYIGTLDRGPCVHPKLSTIPQKDRGPFETEQQMNEAFTDSCSLPVPLKSYKLSNLRSQHKIAFSYGQIRLHHVVVADGRVQAILDWSQSGYYPEHWEFISATSNIDWDSDWGVYVQKFLKPYYEDFAMWTDFMGVLT